MQEYSDRVKVSKSVRLRIKSKNRKHVKLFNHAVITQPLYIVRPSGFSLRSLLRIYRQCHCNKPNMPFREERSITDLILPFKTIRFFPPRRRKESHAPARSRVGIPAMVYVCMYVRKRIINQRITVDWKRSLTSLARGETSKRTETLEGLVPRCRSSKSESRAQSTRDRTSNEISRN